MNEPNRLHCLLKRKRRSSRASKPVVAPQVTRRPAGARDSKLYAALAGDLLYFGGNILLVVIDHVVGAEFARFGEFGLTAGGGDHAALEQPGNLNGGGTDTAGCRQDKDILAGLEFSAPHEHVPRGEKHQRSGGGIFEAHLVGNLDGAVLGRCEQFGITAIDGVAEHGKTAAEVVVA
jgi:hypothetical protein